MGHFYLQSNPTPGPQQLLLVRSTLYKNNGHYLSGKPAFHDANLKWNEPSFSSRLDYNMQMPQVNTTSIIVDKTNMVRVL